MIKITAVQHMHDYFLQLTFDDGTVGEIDIAEQVRFEGVFRPMKDLDFFKRVRINQIWGTIEWPGEIDFDPEVLYEEVTLVRQVESVDA